MACPCLHNLHSAALSTVRNKLSTHASEASQQSVHDEPNSSAQGGLGMTRLALEMLLFQVFVFETVQVTVLSESVHRRPFFCVTLVWYLIASVVSVIPQHIRGPYTNSASFSGLLILASFFNIYISSRKSYKWFWTFSNWVKTAICCLSLSAFAKPGLGTKTFHKSTFYKTADQQWD